MPKAQRGSGCGGRLNSNSRCCKSQMDFSSKLSSSVWWRSRSFPTAHRYQHRKQQKQQKQQHSEKKKEKRNREEEITIQPIKDTREKVAWASAWNRFWLMILFFLSVVVQVPCSFSLSFFFPLIVSLPLPFFSASFFIASRRDDRTARELYKCCRRCRCWIFHTLI
jgi:Flp pilus assembly protein TadB